MDKKIEEEKQKNINKLKSFFNIQDKPKTYIVDPKNPTERVMKFNSDLKFADKNKPLPPDLVWQLMVLAMDPTIKPGTLEHGLFHALLGLKLEIQLQSNDLLTKLRWWNNFYDIRPENFNDYCERAKQTKSFEEVEKIYQLKPRAKPLVIGIATTLKTEAEALGKDLANAVGEAADSANKLFSFT